MCIITVYRSPSGNFNHFLQSLDTILQTLYTPALSFIICGDININYLVVNEQRKQLDNLLLLYNLIGIVDFPRRHNHTSSSAIDNIFIDISHFHDYSLTPFSNDLSDHDAQILISKTLCQSQYDRTTTVRKVDQHTISDFIDKLSKESWDSTFNNTDVNHMFNSFLNTFLRIFYSCFPLARIKNKKNNTISWITLGIKKIM